MMRIKKLTQSAMVLFFAVMPYSAFAGVFGGTGLPWEQFLKTLSDSITGRVAYSIALIAIAVSGLTMAFGDLQGGARKFVTAGLGGSIAFFAVQIISTLYNVIPH